MASKKQKYVVVLFSSGLDSTYLMYKNLEDENIVIPVYVEIKNNEDKSLIEKQNAKILIDLFKKNYTEDRVYDLRFITEITVRGNTSSVALQQLPIWILGLLYTASGYDEAHIGYVSNDDAISYLDEIKKIYKSYDLLCDQKKLPVLKFPLIKNTKQQMMSVLPSEYRRYVTSCEYPQLKPFYIKMGEHRLRMYEPCGHCVPCKRIIKDGLAYNFLYQKMIEKEYNARSLGMSFTYMKETHPEIFKKFEHELYKEIEIANQVDKNYGGVVVNAKYESIEDDINIVGGDIEKMG